jgi:homoserine O-acetyltransferase/O-succinyltransferase
MSSPFAAIIHQDIFIVPSFTLECEQVLRDAPVAYKTWGALNEKRDNVMVICHAFTGSADVEDWCVFIFLFTRCYWNSTLRCRRWGPLMGRGKAFDARRYFIVCLNVLGSPYGSASPVTVSPDTGRPYGPEFPPTTIRDDVRQVRMLSIKVCPF